MDKDGSEHPIKSMKCKEKKKETEQEKQKEKEKKWKFSNKTTYRIGNGWII